MDGYCDVNDALASCGTREKMLNIMSDPNIGSFAAVRAGLYLLIQLGLFAQIKTWPMMAVCALSFVQSRALSGLGTVLLKSAKESGALQSFRRPADRRAVIVSEPAVLLLTLILAALADPICGGCAFAAEAVCFVYYRKMSYKKFGGVTGDLAGYFLQICELGAVGAAVFADLVRSAVL